MLTKILRQYDRRTPARLTGLFAAILLVASLVTGCGGSHTQSNVSTTTGTDPSQPGWTLVTSSYKATTTKPWTVLIYMDGANNLDTYALANFNQLEQVGSTANMNIVVQFKRGQGYDANAQYQYDSSEGGWSGTRRYYVTQSTDTSNIDSTLISTNATLDMGNYQSMQSFIQWGVASYPAQHYCLIVWDHGSGWRSETIGATTSKSATTTRAATARAVTTRGVAFDDTTSDYILTTQLPQATAMPNGAKWDLLVFDCSLMQMMEVDYEISNQTNYVLGSEESPPGGGYNYTEIANDINSNPTWSGVTLGTNIAQQTLAFYLTAPTVGGQLFDVADYADWVTQSVVNTSKLPNVAIAFNNLGSVLTTAESTYASQIDSAINATEQYGVHDETVGSPTYQVYESYRDGMNFTQNLATLVPSTAVQNAAAAAKSALQAAIVTSVHGASHPNSNGLSFYIPAPGQYAIDDQQQAAGGVWYSNSPNDRYTDLALAQVAPNWQNFLATSVP